MVRHWVELMVEGSEERSERLQEGILHSNLFYTDNGMVASSEPCWIQGAFDTLVGLFDRVGLRTNVGETVDMICRPFQVAVNQSEAAYRRRITGKGISYRE